jgi:hypothetical protein
MSTIQKFSVSGVNNPGPNATAVSFMKNDDGIRHWAWVRNADAARIRPGMTVTLDVTGFGSVQTDYTDRTTQQVVALKVPKMQVFYTGKPVVEAPANEPIVIEPAQFGEGVDDYAAKYDAKRNGGSVPAAVADGNEPF